MNLHVLTHSVPTRRSSDLQMAATRALRNEATAAARAARTVNDRRAGLNQAPSAIATRNYAAAMERARVAAGNLANAQARLQALNGQMAASTGAMATATQRFRAAQTAADRKSTRRNSSH